ncbi:hypothetical protein BU17DRAFT_59992 [Hysterangium stoloniferum]|nr:hypothetical protein BU17DRAFT_59992 [Hysterangium stoloniferum]
MTPSPSPTPASSSNSPQASSPSNTTTIDPSRPPFVPLTLPPISQFAYRSEFAGHSYYYDQKSTPGPSRSPSVPAPSLSDSYRRLRHGKQRSDDSLAASSSDNNTTPYGAIDDELHSDPEEAAPGDQIQKKKKRTRTLTTPHQSAVLHALLAQSRFPTTAMREEVGRTIGLSARKVQVWFQNQRQKARKPRTPSANPATVDSSRPAQFESFGSASNTEEGPVAGPSSTASAFQGADRGGSTSTYISESPTNAFPPRGLPASLHSTPHPTPHPPEFVAPRYIEHGPLHPSGLPHSAEGLPPSTEVNASGRANFDPSPLFPHHTSQYHPARSTPFPGPHFVRHSQSFGELGLSPSAERPIQLPPLRLDNPNLRHALTRPSSTNPAEFHHMSTPSLSPLEISPPAPGSFVDRSLIPPPFTLQPTPQWEWDRPLNPPVGPRASPVRPRTSSDPVLPPLNINEGRQERPLLTQPWPLPDASLPAGGVQRRSSEGTAGYERFTKSGEEHGEADAGT